MNKTVIIITGPTASGKTSMALQLARQYNTEIISADSRQCFREMNIGVAKPSPSELASVKHHFINSHSIHDEVTAVTFEQYALSAAQTIFQQRDVAIMAGGTGLYIKAFCEGLDDIPDVPLNLRQDIIANYGQNGINWLKDELQKHDPLYAASGEMQNPQRMMRALEVAMATGKSIRDFQRRHKETRDFNIVKYGIEMAKEQLHQNINTRVDQMMQVGLLDEVKSLVPNRHLNALQTVGYTELFQYLDGEISLADAIERIKINTRQYAKRQLTWFRRDKDIQWISGLPPTVPASLSEGKQE